MIPDCDRLSLRTARLAREARKTVNSSVGRPMRMSYVTPVEPSDAWGATSAMHLALVEPPAVAIPEAESRDKKALLPLRAQTDQTGFASSREEGPR
mmetsp:Transcript_12567/g.41430  ORF Transcript_12567/g.41430 Transcript_12567/m.41430 type:complete len:96 (+) Transcript_12567:794-1081(+)